MLFLEDILIRYYSYSWIFSKVQIKIAYIYIIVFGRFCIFLVGRELRSFIYFHFSRFDITFTIWFSDQFWPFSKTNTLTRTGPIWGLKQRKVVIWMPLWSGIKIRKWRLRYDFFRIYKSNFCLLIIKSNLHHLQLLSH